MNKQITVLVFLSIFSCLTLLIVARTSDELRVTLPNGSKLVGRTLRSHSGRSIKSFLGVPYAKPPIGLLRFKVIFQHLIIISNSCFFHFSVCVGYFYAVCEFSELQMEHVYG